MQRYVCHITSEPQSTGPPERMENVDERREDQKPTPSHSQDDNDDDVILVEDSDGEVRFDLIF